MNKYVKYALIIILIVIVCATVGYFVYDSFRAKNVMVPVKEENKNIQEVAIPSKTVNKDVYEVEYKGSVENIFFHPLVAYPEKAFDGDYMEKGFDDWFVTVEEFKKIIDQLYKKNYILININDIYEEKVVNNKLVLNKKKLMLPKGKEPIFISIDDVNYYDYMIKNGTINKLILDENNNVATYTLLDNGEESIKYDNEIIPILDKFVEEHPDFSHKGAKGIIALTGYEGILGYRTQLLETPQFIAEKEQALALIKRLKETGWTFASHSYTHFDLKKTTKDKVVYDANKWEKEVQSLIGSTQIYIYPYGSSVDYKSKSFEYLYKKGFRVFLGVGPISYFIYEDKYIHIDRVHMDGMYFRQNAGKKTTFFDVESVVDKKTRKWDMTEKKKY